MGRSSMYDYTIQLKLLVLLALLNQMRKVILKLKSKKVI
jgi:hypothetical protein